MFEIKFDEDEMKQVFMKKLDEHIKQIDASRTFWDSKELKRQTCMSWSTIQKTFFFDDRCPKHKISQKWYFPAEEMRKFLLEWLKEQK
ncbi:MAG: group-specific protein [Sporolactobacillus sp.]|jgi:hypothetical protein|nr:group-specific protein [Sporolactobacillus sp.]